MSHSRYSRLLSLLLRSVVLILVLAAAFVAGGSPRLNAAFSPAATVTVSDATADAVADVTTSWTLPSGDHTFSMLMTTTPAEATIQPSPGHPSYDGGVRPLLGDIGATLTLNLTLGSNNGTCSTGSPAQFKMLVATVDNSGGNEIPPLPAASTGPLGTLQNMATDSGDAPGAAAPYNTNTYAPLNGLPASVERYPSYLDGLFNDTQPLRRLVGNLLVVGTQMSLNVLVFEPGALKARLPQTHPLQDFGSEFGYTSVVVFEDSGASNAPVTITDSCSPVSMTAVTLGTTEMNACNGNTGPSCDTPAEIGSPASGGDDSGRIAYTNPSTAGTYRWTTFAQSGRDTDGDGIENSLDTCPYDANVDGDPRTTSGPDSDMLDSACDPGPGALLSNEDGDSLTGRAWFNASDNCPTVANGDNLDSEGLAATSYTPSAPRGGPKGDEIGDACDQDNTLANGRFFTVLNVSAVCIGGTDADGDGFCTATTGDVPADPNDGEPGITPEAYSMFLPMPIAHSGSGVNPVVGGTVSPGQGLDYNELSIANDGLPPVTNHGSGHPYQVCNDGVDNDGDGLIDLLDPACEPLGLSTTDTDGDGFSDEAEIHIGTDALGRCEVGAVPNRSTDWPLDLVSGSIPASTDRATIGDLSSFVAPVRRLGTSPGDHYFHPRWDLSPGRGPIASYWINVIDLATFVAGPTAFPRWSPYVRVFAVPYCTPHPEFGD